MTYPDESFTQYEYADHVIYAVRSFMKHPNAILSPEEQAALGALIGSLEAAFEGVDIHELRSRLRDLELLFDEFDRPRDS